MNKEIQLRKNIINNVEQVVIKVGTRLLTDESRIPILISEIAKIKAKGIKVVLVSSGAVGVGMNLLGLSKRPSKLAEVQALAAIGQGRLVALYNEECCKYGFQAAQMLLTAEDLKDRERHLNVLNCLHSLWNNNILPIINENDVVSVDELKFGDNDFLAGLVATMTKSDLTIILTTESGLRNKADGVLTDRISVVDKLTSDLKAQATGTDNRDFSIGGMISKLRAAETVCAAGENLWVADGRVDDILTRIFNAEDVGTLFIATKTEPLQSKKRWIRFFSKLEGKIVIDEGAVIALTNQHKSLLPSGMVFVQGDFERGDSVEICDRYGSVIGHGLVNYSALECRKIVGLCSNDISEVLHQVTDNVVIHCDNLVID
ncbi:glutamate 5-kinase [Lentisphaerota bacterium WC36G]|nr:glutamate 5-kinase [Lentisphaerae bacterium WC36]